LVARGHTVTVVCGAHAQAGLELPFDSAQGWRRGLVDGIDVISLPLPYANRDGVARRTWTFLRFAARSVRLALTLEADLVFATSTPLTAALPGLAAQAARGLPFVFEVRDLWPELPRALGLRNPLLLGGMEVLETAAYRAADAVVGLSPGIVRGIRRKSSPRQCVVMIPNGSDLEVFLPPIGGQTLYVFGRIEDLANPAVTLTARVHDECNGSDVFGSDICTCRPYLTHAIEECIRGAQAGQGSGGAAFPHPSRQQHVKQHDQRGPRAAFDSALRQHHRARPARQQQQRNRA
jgi:GTP cyclohydrolase II